MPILRVSNLSKTYASGFRALKGVSLDIRRGEIFALLGPNGAGKTTLINIVCGIVTPSGGSVTVDGHDIVRALKASGVTIILTTHYIEEAEEMADRIGVMRRGELILVEDKAVLMRKLGKKQLTIELQQPIAAVPPSLADRLTLSDGGRELIYTYDTQGERTGITSLLSDLNDAGIRLRDIHTTQSSLEDIFVGLVRPQ
jgi:YD repeat-containing protein